MKQIAQTAAALLAAALLAGCAPRVTAPADTATPPTPSAPADTAAPTPGAQPTPAAEPGLDYDEMRNVAVGYSTPSRVQEGYFTVSRDGRWGLIRADGTEVLPCLADSPVGRCTPEGHWTWRVPGMSWEEQDSISAELEAEGEPIVCPGHGAGTIIFFYVLDAPRDIHALDPAAFKAYVSSDGPGDVVDVTEEMWDIYGDPLPCYNAHEEGGNGDPVFPSDPVESKTGDGGTLLYWYMCRDGSGRYLSDIQLAGFFYEEQMAPIRDTDGKWSYVDRTFSTRTESVYDAVYDAVRDPETGIWTEEPAYAAPMQNGYAAVRRGDGWGLLCDTGEEVLPCEQQGVAWEGTTLWVKDAAGWHRSELPA